VLLLAAHGGEQEYRRIVFAMATDQGLVGAEVEAHAGRRLVLVVLAQLAIGEERHVGKARELRLELEGGATRPLAGIGTAADREHQILSGIKAQIAAAVEATVDLEATAAAAELVTGMRRQGDRAEIEFALAADAAPIGMVRGGVLTHRTQQTLLRIAPEQMAAARSQQAAVLRAHATIDLHAERSAQRRGQAAADETGEIVLVIETGDAGFRRQLAVQTRHCRTGGKSRTRYCKRCRHGNAGKPMLHVKTPTAVILLRV